MSRTMWGKPLTIQGVKLNPRQANALTQILNASLPDTPEFARKDEVKLLTIYPLGAGRKVVVRIETGRIGDEGTLAASLCRRRGQFYIGPKGGITAAQPYNFGGRKTPKGKVAKFPLIYGWGS